MNRVETPDAYSRWRLRMALLVALSLAAPLAAMTPAAAQDVGTQSAIKCANTHGAAGSWTCGYWAGSGTWLDYVNVTHFHNNAIIDNFCEPWAEVRVTNAQGQRVKVTARVTSGCRLEEGDIAVNIQAHVADNQLSCAQYGHDGALAPGAPCTEIRA